MKQLLTTLALLLILASCSKDNAGNKPKNSPYVTKVFDYVPAPGQFTNMMPKFEAGDTQATMNQRVLESIGNNALGSITLGSYGGYVVVGFDHTIPNIEGKCDFRVLANASHSAIEGVEGEGGSCEPGIIMVAHDTNQNGVPDEGEWREIAGSAHRDPTEEAWYNEAVKAENDTQFYDNYSITYARPAAGSDDKVTWSDNKGGTGSIPKNSYHTQEYYPKWIDSDLLSFEGSRLPQNGVAIDGNKANVVLFKFDFGYADNARNSDDGSAIDISWAVDKNGNSADLEGVDFIKIYTGVNQINGWFGECSTEFSGVEDLHLLGIEIESR